MKNYGVSIWYDNHEHLLGDNKVKNFTSAIYTSKYAIVIISNDFTSRIGTMEELKIIKQQYDLGKIHIFPITYNICLSEIPNEINWIKEMIYNELNKSTGSLLTCNQIICKVLNDYISEHKYPHFTQLTNEMLQTVDNCNFLTQLIKLYQEIVEENINCRMTILYNIIIYLKQFFTIPNHLIKASNYLFNTTKLNVLYDFKETKIMENIITVAINIEINKHHEVFAKWY